jgi:hypothetical protein
MKYPKPDDDKNDVMRKIDTILMFVTIAIAVVSGGIYSIKYLII